MNSIPSKLAIDALAAEISACRICRDRPAPGRAPLPHEPRPVCVLSATARILIAGQAPGTRVHQSGMPFTDPSGDRLRDWMGIDSTVFYDPARVAIVPMGFCFPGVDAKGSDLPPRPECMTAWHDRIFAAMPQVELLLVVGQYAQRYHLGARRRASLTETVAAWREIVGERGQPKMLPLPHPSWRNSSWLKKNPWFAEELLPFLRAEVARLI
ncbi:MAG TPA: uracil-DNA glycosylase family protein [Pararhizobium sp.]|nr:uracil-DNA glycosylase family protein [Pararhizobium sp.]